MPAIDMGTLVARIQGQVGGFDEASKEITTVLQALVKAATDVLAKIPTAIENAMRDAAAAQLANVKENVANIQSIRQQLADKEAELTLTSSQNRIRILTEEGQKTHNLILETVNNRQEAERLIMLNASQVERQITAIVQEEEAKRVASEQQAAARRKAIEQSEKQAKQEAMVKGAMAVGAVGAAAGGAAMPIIADIKASSGVAKQFDADMRNVDSIALMTEGQLKKTSQAVLNMTKDVPKSADDLAKGLYDIQSSGFAGQQALDVLKVSAQGASAGMSTTAESARTLTGLMNAYNLKTGPDAIKMMDVLFQTVKDGVVTFPELANHIGYVSTNAANLHVDLAHVGAAIATLTVNGMRAAPAIQGLNMLLDKLKVPTKEGMKYAHDLGIEWYKTGESAKHLGEVGLDKVLLDLAKATDGNSTKLQLLLGDQEAARTAMILMKNDGEQYLEFLDNANHSTGAMSEALKRQGASFEAMSQYAENAINRVRISMGTTFLEVLNPVLRIVIALADAFEDLPEPIKKIVGYLELATGVGLAAVAALSALTLAVVGLAAIPLAIGAISVAAPFAMEALAGLATAFGAFVTGAITTAAPFIMLAIVIYGAWKTNFMGIQDITHAVLNKMSGDMAIFGPYFMSWWKVIGEYVFEFWDELLTFTSNTMAALEFIVLGATKAVGQIFGFFFSWIINGNKGAMSFIKDNWESTFNGLSSYVGQVMGDILNLIKQNLHAVGEAFSGLADMLANPLHPGAGLSRMTGAIGTVLMSPIRAVKVAAVDTGKALAGLSKDFDAMGVKVLSRAEEIKGGLHSAFSMPAVPDLGSVALQAASLSKTRGIKNTDTGEIYTTSMLKQDLARLATMAKAQRLSKDEQIANLKELESQHTLTKGEQEKVDAKIAQLEDQRDKTARGRHAKRASDGAAAQRAAVNNAREGAKVYNDANEDKLAALEKLRQRTDLTAKQRIQIDKDIAQLQKKINSDANKAMEEGVKNALQSIESERRKADSGSYQNKKEALQTEGNQLNSLAMSPNGSDSVKQHITDRIGLNTKAQEELEASRLTHERALSSELLKIEAKNAKDNLALEIQASNEKFDAMKVKAQEEGNLTVEMDRRIEADRKASIEELNQKELDEKNKALLQLAKLTAKYSSDELQAKLSELDAQFDKEQEDQLKAGNQSLEVYNRIEAARWQAKDDATKTHYSAELDGYTKHANDILGIANEMLLGQQTGWQKLLDFQGSVFDTFKGQLATLAGPILDAVGKPFTDAMDAANTAIIEGGLPALGKLIMGWVAAGNAALTSMVSGAVAGIAAMDTAIVTGGLPALGVLIAGWVAAGAAALEAGLQAAAAWLLALGPAGWLAAGVIVLGTVIAAWFGVSNAIAAANLALQTHKDLLTQAAASASGNKENQIRADYSVTVDQINKDTQDHPENADINEQKKNKSLTDMQNAVAQNALDQEKTVGDFRIKVAESTGDTITALQIKQQQDYAQMRQDLAVKVSHNDMTQEEATAELQQQLVMNQTEMQKAQFAKQTDNLTHYYDTQIKLATDSGDHQKELDLNHQKDLNDLNIQIEQDLENHYLTQEQATAIYYQSLNNLALKYNADTYDQRVDATNKQNDLDAALFANSQASAKLQLAQQYSSGQITQDTYQTGLNQLQTSQNDSQAKQLTSLVAFQQMELNTTQFTADKRVAIETDLANNINKLVTLQTSGLTQAIDDYKTSQDAYYKSIGDAIDNQRENLQNQMADEEAQSKARIQQLDDQNQLLNDQIAAIDAIVTKTNAQAAEAKYQVSITAKQNFDAALAQTTLGPQDMSFDAIKAVADKAKAEFGLERITAQQNAQIQQEQALKKAALAQKELNDYRLSASEQAKITGTLNEAYTDYKNSQTDLIDYTTQKQDDAASNEKQLIQDGIDDNNQQKLIYTTNIDIIDQKYQTMFNDLDTRQRNNKTSWDDMMYSIETSTNTYTQQISNEWLSVETSINNAKAALDAYNDSKNNADFSAGGGSYGSASDYTGGGAIGSGVANQVAQGPQYGGFGFAEGGWVRGGIKGRDSVPVIAQDGEYIADKDTASGIVDLINMFRGLTSGAYSSIISATSAATNTTHNKYEVNINNPQVFNKEMLDTLTGQVNTQLARLVT